MNRSCHFFQLLRTCSLPNLSSDAKNFGDKQNISDEDEAPAEESMNDTNFDDVLEEVGNSNESPDVEDPDEDELSEFCANLQSVLDNSSKPGRRKEVQLLTFYSKLLDMIYFLLSFSSLV